MGEDSIIIGSEIVRRLAEESGLAIAIVDEAARQIDAVNNNSICRHLNPTDEFSAACARFCGEAFEKAFDAGGIIGFECHAGLDCHAVPVRSTDKPLVAIVCRSFLEYENYSKA